MKASLLILSILIGTLMSNFLTVSFCNRCNLRESITDTVPGQNDYESALRFNDEYINQGVQTYWDSVLLYMNKAIAVKHVEASAFMGRFFLFKKMASEKDTTYGLNLLRFAADKNSSSAIYDLGIYLFCTGKYVEGEKYLLKADSLGNPNALFELSICYSRGKPSVTVIGCLYSSVPKDREKELKYCKMAAAKGSLGAQKTMMYYYMNENNDSAFKCIVLQILENSNLKFVENAGIADDIDMILSEKYGSEWQDTVNTWNCENE